LCPRGNYCEKGAGTVLNTCAEGTFMPYYGAKLVTDCQACSPGFACPGTSDDGDTRVVCTSGSYCVASTGATSTAVPCTAGHYCPETSGSSDA